jgi:outer membrane protein OmpA-like peptidoglycan-associated protein
MDAVKGYLTPDVVRSASSLVGESESSTRQTLNSAVPTVLSGLINMASTPAGASGLAGLIRNGGFGSAVDNVSSLFTGGSATSGMLSVGSQLLGKIFGGRSSAVADLLARSGGVSSASATSLLSLTAPLVMGVLSKRAAAQGLDASGLANSLLAEKTEITAAAPSGLSQLLTAGPSVVSKASETATRYPPATTDVRSYAEMRRSGLGRWLPLVLLVLGALALLSFLRGRTPKTTVDTSVQRAGELAKTAMSNIALPGGMTLSVPTGSMNYNLARYLGDTTATDVPRTFVFDHLNFESGSSQLTPDSDKTVNDLAQVLKAYPNAQVQIVGHTDNTGSADANKTLSLSRAEAIKGLLVSEGVAANRIATQGLGQDRPIASNDTEEGRARNRRIELNVTKK